MFRELTKLGIAESRIWKEDKSTSTMENLDFSLALIQEKTGVRSPIGPYTANSETASAPQQKDLDDTLQMLRAQGVEVVIEENK